jgi:peptide/nickel transport system permease protein
MRKFWPKFFRNRLAILGGILVLLLLLSALLAPLFSPYQKAIDQNFSITLQSPNSTHILGTDDLGRDLFTRILYGTRVSLLVGVIVVTIGMITGVFFGLLSGFFGGWVDNLIMRLTDIFLAFPFLLLAIAISALLGPNLRNGIIALSCASIPSYIRLVRGSVLSLKENTYIEAARVCGSSNNRIIFSHLLPNLFGTLLVYGTLKISTAILAEAGLSYLGLSVQPPDPSWGKMLFEGKPFIMEGAWWLTFFPGLAIVLTVMGFNCLGDGLRDILDPRLRETKSSATNV